ncbi:hypothetical protein ABPG72_007920 [Tetrahymena utriculariae]
MSQDSGVSLLEQLRIAVENKKKAQKMKDQLKQDLEQRLQNLTQLSLTYCQQKNEIQQIQIQINENKSNYAQYEKRLLDYKKYSSINKDNNALLQERKQCLELYQTKLYEIFHECDDKYKKIDVLETVINSKRRLCCYQLCTIFFNSKFTCFLFLTMISRVFRQYEQISTFEENINAALGYYGLLVQQISKIYDINLKHKIIYKGCRTQIQKDNQELHNLYILKKEDSRRLQNSLTYLIIDIFQIFDVINLDKQYKKCCDILVLLNILSQFLQYGEIQQEV